MPIYAYRCECGHQEERFERIFDSTAILTHSTCPGTLCRDYPAERPAMQSYDGAGTGRPGTTGVYDQGAGTYFADGVRGAEYRAWCDANTKNGVRPEPMSKAQIDDSINRCARNELPTVSEKEHTRQWMKAWRDGQKDRQKAQKITL